MNITSAEALIMDALWRREPLSAEDIVADVAAQGWSEATVKTFLNRLLKKGAIAASSEGRRYLYRPVLQRTDFVDAESQGFLERMFDGRLAPLVSHLSERRKLTAEDVAELKRLINELEP
ncbi:BlaI/MecI/CopY family transcriptional regulator [Caulobacter sp. 73W]|uniref:BlaI/MecI/CopY family transcriptional regulator n=1 Tax=Caulobacter sp. 73W TaxID=3161137 RepID=A0AB39KZC5_9CAUL